jgi:hypothetical protein
MARHHVAALCCVLLLAGTVSGCAHPSAEGRSGLVTAGSASPSGPAEVGSPSTAPTTTRATPTPTTGHTTPNAGHTTSTAGHTTAPPTSSAPDPTDYEISWSNALCHWNVDSNNNAHVTAAEMITANVAHTTGTVKSTVTNNGTGIPTGSETVPTKFLPVGTYSFLYTFTAPESDIASNSVTFTATLTFDGVADQLPTDNVSALKIDFPATFMPGPQGDENLVCEHVNS